MLNELAPSELNDGVDASGVVHDEMHALQHPMWDQRLEDRTSFGPINWELGRKRFADGVEP